MRACIKCGEAKETSQFYAHKQRKDGLHPWCKACVLASQREYGRKYASEISARGKAKRQQNKEAYAARDKAYYEANKAKCNAASRAYYEAHKQEIIAYQKRYAADHPEQVAEYKQRNKLARPDTVKAEYERNKPAYFARAAERRATKTSRTPEWADEEAIAEYYKAVRTLNTYFGAGAFHVDHIVPLKSKLVSGLHTEANLQMLLGKDNLSKNNRSWPHMSQLL